MTLPWDAEAPGADAHTLEAAYQALHPTALRGFLNANAHHLTPACFDKIMGVGRGGDVEHNGLYWKSGPTLVATDTVNELPDGAVGVWLGACNGHWAVFNTTFTVRMLDLFPRHKKVKMHACDGTPYAAPGSQDFIMYACSLPAPSFLPPALRLALRALRNNGTFVATDIAGRDSPVMTALEALLRAYARLGLGRVERRQMHVPNQREVDQITFVRTAGEDGALDVDVPLLPLPERNRVPVLKAVLGAPIDTLPPIVAQPAIVFEHAAVDAGSSSMARAGCYALVADKSVYCGSAIDVEERTATHAITLGAGGNQGLADILSRYPDDTSRTAATSGGLIFGANEYHPQKIAQLLQGTPLTVRLVDFLVRFGEQIALNLMMNHGYHLKMLNKHISGFSQGVQAHAAANGAPRTSPLKLTAPPPSPRSVSSNLPRPQLHAPHLTCRTKHACHSTQPPRSLPRSQNSELESVQTDNSPDRRPARGLRRRLRRPARRDRRVHQRQGRDRDHESATRPWRGRRSLPMGRRQGRRAAHLWPMHVGGGSQARRRDPLEQVRPHGAPDGRTARRAHRRLRHPARRDHRVHQPQGRDRDHESATRPWRGRRSLPMGRRRGRRAAHLWPVHVGGGSQGRPRQRHDARGAATPLNVGMLPSRIPVK